jgi:hypothetical protein
MQGRKLMFACDQLFTKLISMLEYKFGKLMIRDYETLIQQPTVSWKRDTNVNKSHSQYDRSVLDTRIGGLRLQNSSLRRIRKVGMQSLDVGSRKLNES